MITGVELGTPTSNSNVFATFATAMKTLGDEVTQLEDRAWAMRGASALFGSITVKVK